MPPLLLTKRLTSLLHANLSTHLHSSLLATPSGKLLAHASPHPVADLRAQATAAASLCAIHAAATPAAATALPIAPAIQQQQQQQQQQNNDNSHKDASYDSDEHDGVEHASGNGDRPRRTAEASIVGPTPRVGAARGDGGDAGVSGNGSGSDRGRSGVSAITVQLACGTVVIRKLRCGLLLVCVGPLPGTPAAETSGVHGANSNSSDAAVNGYSNGHSNGHSNGTSHSNGTDHGNGTSISNGHSSALQVQPANDYSHTHQHEEGNGTGPVPSAAPSTEHTPPPASPTGSSDGAASPEAQTTTSVTSQVSTTTASVAVMRRQAEDLARWLDEKLGTLLVPDEGVGVAEQSRR